VIRRLAFAILAGLALPLPSLAAPLTREPAPAALEIARTLFDLLGPRLDPDIARREQRMVEQSMEEDLLAPLESEPPCDRSTAECRAAARAVAGVYAPEALRLDRERRVLFFAYLLQDSMSPDQLSRVAAHLGTDEGRLFVEAWRTILPGTPSPRWREIEAHLVATMPSASLDARALFRRRTAHLPRTREAPSVMMPQTPPPSTPRGETP
jgi:hypothetical protein